MSLLLSFVGFFAASFFISLSFLLKEEVESQITRMLGALLFCLSFLFTPLLIKLFIVLAFFLLWPYLGERLSLSFYRQLNK